MVEYTNIQALSLEKLSNIIDIYPWYAGARMELCRRMAAQGCLSDELLAATAIHLGSRKLLAKIARDSARSGDARDIISAATPTKREVYVVGGDYFSQEQYNKARKDDDGLFASFASKEGKAIAVGKQGEESEDFCTETLARIYLEQDYRDKAIDIYYKLSLRYPEKSVYFASLIDEIKQKEQ